MLDSVWVYNCAMGLSQSNCDRHEDDDASRGYGRSEGCSSCLHRLPANIKTKLADDTFERTEFLRKVGL